MSQPTVYIDGDQGTTGLLIHERLRGRDDLQLVTLPDTERRIPCGAPKRSTQPTSRSCACRRGRARGGRLHPESGGARDRREFGPSHAAGLVYGFPRWRAGTLDDCARRVTNPGCYPTGAIALLRPATGRPAAARLPGEHPCRLRVLGRRPGRRRRIRVERCFARETASGLRPRTRAQACAGDPVHAGLTNRPMFVPAYGAYRQASCSPCRSSCACFLPA